MWFAIYCVHMLIPLIKSRKTKIKACICSWISAWLSSEDHNSTIQQWKVIKKKKIDYSFQSTHHSYLHGNGHIAWIHSITGLQPHHIEMPVPMRWPKLSSVEPGHYLVGWLLGNIRWMCRNMKLITTWN